MKQLLLILAGLLLAGGAHAQFGLRAGANYAAPAMKARGQYQSANAAGRLGYQAGAFYEQRLAGPWSLLPEVQLSQQKTAVAVRSGYIDYAYEAAYTLRLTSLNLPVLLRRYFGRFYAEAGPQVGFLLKAHEEGTEYLGSFVLNPYRSFNQTTTTHYHRVAAGLCTGVGVQLPAGFGAGVRAYADVSPVGKEQPDSRYFAGLRNRLVQATVSYQLGRNQ